MENTTSASGSDDSSSTAAGTGGFPTLQTPTAPPALLSAETIEAHVAASAARIAREFAA